MADRNNQDFRQYPMNLDRSEIDTDNLHLYWSELEKRSSTLFVQNPGKCSVELWRTSSTIYPPHRIKSMTCPALSCVHLSSLKDVEEYWAVNDARSCASESQIVIINRMNSWSRMKILLEMFQYICSALQIHPRFLDLAFGFGQKLSSQDEMMMSFSRTTSFLKSDDSRPFSFDISYILRYYEPHGRQQSDPWSQRQSAIHQKFDFESANSNWIIIHPPVLLQGSLQDARLLPSSHPMSFHIRYIRASMHYWRDYLNYRSSELLDLDFKVSIQKSLTEYMIDMSTIQKVQFIRKKLYIALPILDGGLEVIIGLRKQAELIRDALGLKTCISKAFEDELDHISSQIENYKSCAQSLVKIADGIYFLTQNALSFHNQDLAIKNGASIAQISQSSLFENRLITATTDKTYRDSRTMRIATVVAMFYLPANLVMSFFSTGLVDFYSSGETAAASSAIKIRVYSQVWIPAVTSIILAAITMFIVAVWDHRGRR